MIVSELRELLKSHKEDDLRVIIVEMYKAMPKALKEEKNIDQLIRNPDIQMAKGKNNAQREPVDVSVLQTEIERFVGYAYKQYYFAPNSYVHKKDRPKWRFIVKNYIKEIDKVPIDGEEGAIATGLLLKLYNMLCYACSYYIFSTDYPFRSVGISQTEVLERLLVRVLGLGINKKSVHEAIKMVVFSGSDHDTPHASLNTLLVSHLKTSDAKIMAVEECKLLIKNDIAKISTKKESRDDIEKKVENAIGLIVMLYMELCEYDEAIRFYKETVIAKDPNAIRQLLYILEKYDLKEHWLREYDLGLKMNVNYGEYLKAARDNLLTNGVFR